MLVRLHIFLLKFKEEDHKFNKEIVEYNLQLNAHNGSGFATWIISKNLLCDKHIVDIIKTGKGIISTKVFNGYIQNNKKQIPQYLFLRCGMTHLNYSLKKLGKTINLQKEFLKTEMNHDEITGDIWRVKKDDWVGYVQE